MDPQELDHTSATLAAMDASHERLAKSKDEYEKQTPLLTKSRRLLSKMSWHSILDNLVLYGCLTIFFAVVAYIVYKRLIYFVPSFLIPSFGRSPALGQKLGQSPASIQPSGAPPGSPLSPSVGGPPSNDRWYEAQPGYDKKDSISDDKWYQAQPDDSPHRVAHGHPQPSPRAASSQHDDSSSTQQQQQQQQQQRQLEEAYREAAPQPITPPDGSTQGSLHSAETGTPADAAPAKGMPAADVPSGLDLSASQAASKDVGLSQSGSQPDPVLQARQPKLRDSSTQTPPKPSSDDAGIQQTSDRFSQGGNEKESGNPQQAKAVPGINVAPAASRAAVPPISASHAELDIRKGLEQSSIPEPPKRNANSASQSSAADAGQPGLPGKDAVLHERPTSAADAAEQGKSTAGEVQRSADDVLLAADLEAPSAGTGKSPEDQAAEGQVGGLDTYPGLEQVTYPEALDIAETTAAHNSSLAEDAQQDASLLEGGDLSDTTAARHNSSKPELADDDVLEPSMPSQQEGARVFRTASSLADSASEEGELDDGEPELEELQALPEGTSADAAQLNSSQRSSQGAPSDDPSKVDSASLGAPDLDAKEGREGEDGDSFPVRVMKRLQMSASMSGLR